MRTILILLVLITGYLHITAQELHISYLPSDSSSNQPAGTLKADIFNNNFLKNNEYFDPLTEGITYLGSEFQPEITYAFTRQARLSAGWYFRYYYGTEKFNLSLPVFRFEYEPVQNVKLVFGQLKGHLNHKLLQPIDGFDNYFKRNPEYGVQLITNGFRFNSDVWMSWDHFILPGDNKQEEITAGFRTLYKLIGSESFNGLFIDFQGLIHHFGGQVDLSDAPLQTRLNIAAGLKVNKSCIFVKGLDWRISSYLIQAADASGKATLPYKKGFASYSTLNATWKFASLGISYFHGEYYFAPLGEQLFQSVSELNTWYTEDRRDLMKASLELSKTLVKGVSLGFMAESFYDLHSGNLNFNYGLNIRSQISSQLFNRKH
jgi:hypothetical protein